MKERDEQGNISKEGKRSRTILQGTQLDQVAVPERLQILSRDTNGYQHKQYGDVSSQKFIESIKRPSDIEINYALNEKGLFRENNYSFGNEFISVTDVEGDNVIKGLDGKIYFIDPLINFKKL